MKKFKYYQLSSPAENSSNHAPSLLRAYCIIQILYAYTGSISPSDWTKHGILVRLSRRFLLCNLTSPYALHGYVGEYDRFGVTSASPVTNTQSPIFTYQITSTEPTIVNAHAVLENDANLLLISLGCGRLHFSTSTLCELKIHLLLGVIETEPTIGVIEYFINESTRSKSSHSTISTSSRSSTMTSRQIQKCSAKIHTRTLITPYSELTKNHDSASIPHLPATFVYLTFHPLRQIDPASL